MIVCPSYGLTCRREAPQSGLFALRNIAFCSYCYVGPRKELFSKVPCKLAQNKRFHKVVSSTPRSHFIRQKYNNERKINPLKSSKLGEIKRSVIRLRKAPFDAKIPFSPPSKLPFITKYFIQSP